MSPAIYNISLYFNRSLSSCSLAQGVYENYLQQKMPDPNFMGICEALQWFCFSDLLQQQISRQQNYSVYPYLQYGFVVWHLLFATLAWPKIAFPTRGFEVCKRCDDDIVTLGQHKRQPQ